MKNKKTTIQVTEQVDTNTGEILNIEHKKVSYSQEPEYVKMYLEDIGMLYKLSGTQNDFIRVLLRKMNYDNEVYIHKAMREEIKEKMGIGERQIRNNFEVLVNGRILMKLGNNHYLFNPNLFAKGSWMDIKTLRMTITYSKEGRMIKTEFGKNTEAIQQNMNFYQE